MTINKILRTILTSLATAACFLISSCSQENEKENISKYDVVNIKWHLTKFVDIANNKEKLAESNSNNVYWIKFLTDDEFEGKAYLNKINGNYNIDVETRTINILNIEGNESYELYDGDKFLNLLYLVNNFHVSGDTLRLLYNNRMNYMQFERLD